ncbi:MAG: tRNA epoxyqueuosine(34) reductase QueG [Pseudomonadales bacterium]|nr:tRNA epoxyqueuosine(34) reductase QueG [Pseudomonadales bacterium]
MPDEVTPNPIDPADLPAAIRRWGTELGFQQTGITDTTLEVYADKVRAWLAAGHHGGMDWLARNLDKRLDPALLEPGTCRVISARMDYRPPGADPLEVLADPRLAYVSRYALGRDYHRVVRHRLTRLARRIDHAARALDGRFRAFTDSAPVLEKALAEKAGLGWIGKHTLLLNEQAGSWFFLGEIYTNLPLPIDAAPAVDRCGNCRACMTVCPTGAIVGPHRLDARRCISYLTIEHRGSIPPELRPLIGNRIFGCDDCQLHCPWNRHARLTAEPDFAPRHGLDQASLVALFGWSEAEYLARTEGSALRRAGYERWQRNLAVALGNGPPDAAAIAALRARRASASELLREHVDWALARLGAAAAG